ncbi:MAG: hypothetical protein L0K86_16800 [Actinomycetia bacterium]|nr:hypothetical protein [Actinomycetes bacterium]
MRTHVFVGETKARGLIVAAATCAARDVNAYRSTMRSLLLPRQRRIHFHKESESRRHKVVGAILELDLTVRIYAVDRDNAVSRRRCLEAIVRDAAATADRLVLERDESTRAADH